MFPCYSLLNLKVIYMVSAPSPFQWRDLIWKFAKMFSSICGGDKPLWGELKIYGGVIFITTLSLFYFFRNRKHQENWSLSFKNFFRKCECISCYLTISSNLLKRYSTKTSPFELTVTGVMEESVLLTAISNYCCNSCDQTPWKNICEENQF